MKVTIEVTDNIVKEITDLANEIRENLESDRLWSSASAAAYVLDQLAQKIEEGK